MNEYLTTYSNTTDKIYDKLDNTSINTNFKPYAFAMDIEDYCKSDVADYSKLIIKNTNNNFTTSIKKFTTIPNIPTITNHTYHNGVTTIYWDDNTKTTVFKDTNEPDATEFNGFMIAIAKKIYGNKNEIFNLADKWLIKVPKQKAIEEEKAKAEKIEKERIEKKKRDRRAKQRIRLEAIRIKQSWEASELANKKYHVPTDFYKSGK